MDLSSQIALSLYAGATIFIIFFIWNCWQKEKRLPAACHYEDLLSRIHELESSVSKRRDELDLMDRSIADGRETLRKVQNDISHDEIVRDKLGENNGQSSKILKEIETNISALRLEESDLLSRIYQLEKKLEPLHENQRTLEAVLRETKKLEIDLPILQETLLHQRNELIKLSSEREQQELLRMELQELARSHSIQRGEWAKKWDECKVLEQSATQLERSITEQKELLQGLDDAITHHRRARDEIIETTGQASRVLNELEAKVTALRLEESTLLQDRASHGEELRRLLERKTELKITMEKYSQELFVLNEAVKVKQDKLDELKAKPPTHENCVSKTLTRPYLTHHPKRPPIEEKEALMDLERYLQNEELHFDQRTLYRFHTSLKVTYHCPLVILSGISGTGKTLLAQSYAKACGLHFLPLAVQPRWDSPQDLFGYYDFTKGQFAATELSRALVQMDSHGRKQWLHVNSPPEWIDDHLLLVLIDEMNIARVEHYFSELLSKLELRRHCDGHTSRRYAEVSLANCILPTTEQEASLFIDYNVLFVGTLNEDETTIALSDKILDRANVIHFGKPTSFSPSKRTSPVAMYSDDKLSFETWKSWIKDHSSIPSHKLSTFTSRLDRLNQEMGEIGRPFGHRTHQAIIAYIANYPIEGAECAFADQLEQKLLPRLRGVELRSHPLSAMKEIIDELGDEKLKETFSKAKDNSYFDWK